LLCFTNQGQLYWLRVFNIEEGSRTASGRSIANVLSLRPDERISSLIPVRDLDAEHSTAEGLHLLMATRRGLVKKTALAEYTRPRAGGLIGISLDEGDTLIGVALVHAGDESNARPMGRNTRGVKGIALQGDDEVVGMVVADPEGYLLTVCANGYGKRTPFGPNTAGAQAAETEEEVEEAAIEPASETAPAEEEGGETRSAMYYRKQRRGGKGVRDIRTSERNGPVVGVAAVKESDDVMLITTGGMVNRTHAHEIRIVGRNTQGVRLMGLKEGDRIASLARVAPEAEEDEAAPAEAPAE
jgi:DNA gyrase subunit A